MESLSHQSNTLGIRTNRISTISSFQSATSAAGNPQCPTFNGCQGFLGGYWVPVSVVL